MDDSEFTAEELLSLASGLGIADPVFLKIEPYKSWPDVVREEVDSIGRRSLAARSVVDRGPDGTQVMSEVLATTCRLLADPQVYVRIASIGQMTYRMASFLVNRDFCAGVRLTPFGNYRLTLIDAAATRLAIDEVLSLDLEALTNGDGRDVEVIADDLRRLESTYAAGPIEGTEAMFRRAGVSGQVADAMMPLMTEATSVWCVEVYTPSVEARVLNGSVTTWAANPSGMWMAERVSAFDALVRYRRVSGSDVQASIYEGFPTWLVSDQGQTS